METVFAVVTGLLYGAAVYSMLSRSIVRLAIGMVLLTQASNLLIFTAGGLVAGKPPLVAKGADALARPYADPLPQALILTAIVISFGMLAFTIVLIHRVHEKLRTGDTYEMKDAP